MKNFDTISLLKACNQGCKYATNSIENLYSHIKDDNFRDLVDDYNGKHVKIGDRCHELLNKYGADEKDPKPMSAMFAKMGVDLKMMADDSSEKVAEMLLDGCHMGIKSIGKYMNKYDCASDDSRKLAKELIDVEENFMKDLIGYI